LADGCDQSFRAICALVFDKSSVEKPGAATDVRGCGLGLQVFLVS
jgi:hypothetical protein